MHSLVSIISLGLDSFCVCMLVGMRSVAWRERAFLALGFGAWDAFGTLLGSTLGSAAPHGLEIPAVVAYAIAALVYLGMAPSGRWALYALPVLCGLDNLLAGPPARLAPALGVSSAVLALGGLCFGELCSRLWRRALAPARWKTRQERIA
jgi:hypothetical protein